MAGERGHFYTLFLDNGGEVYKMALEKAISVQ